jgi:hypothetical protein
MKLASYSKPPLGASVNWGHPLAVGLEACWLLNEGGGVKLIDKANNHNATVTTTTSFTPLGYKITMGSGSPGSISATIACTQAQGYSIAWLCKPSSMSFYPRRLLINSSTYGFCTSDTGGRLTYLKADGNEADSTSVLVSTSKITACGAGCKDGTIYYYANGKFDSSVTDVTNITDITFNTLFYGGGSNRGFAGDMYYVYLWKRQLTANEFKSLHEAPYQFIDTYYSRRVTTLGSAANNEATADANSITITQYDPTIVWSGTYTCDVNEIGIVQYEPDASPDTPVTPDCLNLSITQYDPTIQIDCETTPDCNEIAIYQYEPGTSTGADDNAACGAEELTITFYDPSIQIDCSVTADCNSITFSQYDPTQVWGGSVTPDCNTITITQYEATATTPTTSGSVYEYYDPVTQQVRTLNHGINSLNR